MLKCAVAGVVLILGFVAVPASAAPLGDDSVSGQLPKPYDSEDPARIRQEMDRARASEVVVQAPVNERAPNAGYSADAPARECADCPPPRHYDSTEVVKNSHDVDQSRVINTETVVQVPPRTREINKLIVQENETRNVGVIQHNHRIIEKEIRYVRRAPVYQRPVHQYVPQYRVVQQTVLVPVAPQPVQSCGCPCTCSGSSHNAYGAYAAAYTYRPGFAFVERGTMQKVWIPVPTGGYGYR